MTPRLILASTSPYRQELLARLGLDFLAVKPPFDEENAKAQAPKDPAQMAAFLAKGKAQSAFEQRSQTAAGGPQNIVETVIGGDQLVAFQGQVLGKPGTREQAIKQLMAMQGQTHQLITSTCVIKQNYIYEWTHLTTLTMQKLSIEQVAAYVDLDLPLDCAGSYKIEKHGIALFEKIECDDWTAIQGLPLVKLGEILRQIGFQNFLANSSQGTNQ